MKVILFTAAGGDNGDEWASLIQPGQEVQTFLQHTYHAI